MEQPIWEGFDEWAHFAYVQHLAHYGHAPSRTEPVSDELRRSLELAPISASVAEYSRKSLTHDGFWQLSAEDRTTRERELQELRPSCTSDSLGDPVLRQYEAQQPPLYYVLLLPAYYRSKTLHCPRKPSLSGSPPY